MVVGGAEVVVVVLDATAEEEYDPRFIYIEEGVRDTIAPPARGLP